jgi:putative phosphoesterase
MKIGLFSDIHANKFALESVLSELQDADVLLCAGDVVGYGPDPDRVASMVREHADACVRGNHDRALTTNQINEYESRDATYKPLKLAKESLSTTNFNWLSNLPPVASTEVARICHSHPTNEDEYVAKRDFPKMGKYCEKNEIFLLGHTHDQSKVDLRDFGHDVVVINPGSVGHPRNGDPRAEFAVVEIYNGNVESVELRQTDYDYEATRSAAEDAGLPEETLEQYITGGDTSPRRT